MLENKTVLLIFLFIWCCILQIEVISFNHAQVGFDETVTAYLKTNTANWHTLVKKESR